MRARVHGRLLRRSKAAIRARLRVAVVAALLAGSALTSAAFPPAGRAVPQAGKVTVSPGAIYLPANGAATATVTATVVDSTGRAMFGQPVMWSAGGASLSPSTTLTDSNGRAVATLKASSAWGAQT